MSSSLRELLLARLAVILTPAATGAVSVSRSREVSIARSIEPAIVIMPINTSTSRTMGNKADNNRHEFAIEIFVRGDPWDSLADPLDVASQALIAADMINTAAGALGSFCSDIERAGEAFEAQEADRTAGTLTVTYRATYLTSTRAIDRSFP